MHRLVNGFNWHFSLTKRWRLDIAFDGKEIVTYAHSSSSDVSSSSHSNVHKHHSSPYTHCPKSAHGATYTSMGQHPMYRPPKNKALKARPIPASIPQSELQL